VASSTRIEILKGWAGVHVEMDNEAETALSARRYTLPVTEERQRKNRNEKNKTRGIYSRILMFSSGFEPPTLRI
jgi:hypothetical protein